MYSERKDSVVWISLVPEPLDTGAVSDIAVSFSSLSSVHFNVVA